MILIKGVTMIFFTILLLETLDLAFLILLVCYMLNSDILTQNEEM